VPVLEINLYQFLQGTISVFPQSKRLPDSWENQRGIAHRSQEHQADAIGKFVQQRAGDCERHARFADPSGTSERQETRLWAPEQHTDLCHLVLAPNQWREGDWQMAGGGLFKTSGLLGRKRDDLVLHGERPPQCLLERVDVMKRSALIRNAMLSFALLLYPILAVLFIQIWLTPLTHYLC
jgi:hypothetical protein